MGIKGYRQIMEVENASDLTGSMGREGDIAYAWDVRKHFMFDSSNWIQVSDRTQAQIDTAVASKADLSSISAVGLSGQYSDIIGRPANRSQSSATRSFNSPFQVSTTRDASVFYSASILNALSLAGGSVGAIILEIATNSGFSSGVQELGRISNSNTGTLVIGLALNDSVATQLSGYVPAGYWVKLRTATSSGTPTYTYLSGQEVWL